MLKCRIGNFPKSFLFIPLLIGTSLFLCGQVPSENNEIRAFLSNHIPVDNQNWEICQNPRTGYIYFANSAGLGEYNGINSRVFRMPFNQGIRSVYVNDQGIIFTGSFEDFGYWEENETGSLAYKSLTRNLNISKNDEIWNIFDYKGNIFFQSFTTIYKYDFSGVEKIVSPAIMLFQFKAGEKFIVQAIGIGLYWFDGSDFDFIEGSEVFASLKVHAVIDQNPGQYWICTSNDGIFLFDGVNFFPFRSEISDFLKEETCNAGLAINDSVFVFGTILKGIVFCDEKGDIQKTYDYSNGLNNSTVLSLYRDKDDGLWIGLDEGANFINVTSPVTQYANFSGTLGTIYAAIRNLDKLYLGTNHGLFVADIVSKKGDYNFMNLRMIQNTQGQVWTLEQFDDQILCGHNDGTFLVDDNGNIKWISDVTGGWSIKQYNDLLLEGTYTGIISFSKDDDGRWIYRNRIKDFIEPTRSVEIDYLGFVWAAHPHKGIYKLELNEATDSIVSTMYFSSIADTSNKVTMSRINNQVVFMTSDNICAFDYGEKTFFPLRSLEAGLGEYVKATQIIPYKKNNYWFILGNSIALFEINRELEAARVLEFFHKYAELPGREQQVMVLDDETLLIPTREAFTTFDINLLGKADEPQIVIIDRLVFSGKSTGRTITHLTENNTVPNKENNLTVFIARPSGFDREGQDYLYRMPELGDQWYRTIQDNFSFLNLRYGHYHIQVKLEAGDKITEVEFTVKRPGFMSATAFIIYSVILAGLIFAGVRIFRIELNRHRRLIEYEVGKNRLENELSSKNYELMLTMRYLIEKNEIMTELQSQIILLKEQSSKFPQKFVNQMERIINNGLNSQTEEWKNAMNTLKLTQQGFFKKLLEKYPQLTPNDLRLCSYLRMNFTTKEIAKLLNISPRAVEISRYRLRRKMNIARDINLTEYLIREVDIKDT